MLRAPTEFACAVDETLSSRAGFVRRCHVADDEGISQQQKAVPYSYEYACQYRRHSKILNTVRKDYYWSVA